MGTTIALYSSSLGEGKGKPGNNCVCMHLKPQIQICTIYKKGSYSKSVKAPVDIRRPSRHPFTKKSMFVHVAYINSSEKFRMRLQ